MSLLQIVQNVYIKINVLRLSTEFTNKMLNEIKFIDEKNIKAW